MKEQESGGMATTTATNLVAVATESDAGQAATLAGERRGVESSLPKHLMGLEGGEWALWRWVAVRGAGFPAGGVLQLSAPAAASAADLLLSAEARVQERRAAVIALFDSELERLRREQRWEADKTYRIWLLNSIRTLRLGKKLKLDEQPQTEGEQISIDEMKNVWEQLNKAEDELAGTRVQYQKGYATGAASVSEALRTVATDARFREAITWQNRNALHGSIDAIFRLNKDDKKHGAKRRKHEDVVASYWQRYCVKNDTIGFFGPVGWAKIVDEPEAFDVRPGTDLLSSRTVFLEQWCIDALAKSIGQNKAFRIWMSPRRPPHIRIENGTVIHPLTGVIKLPPEMVTVLAACDGMRTAKEVAAALVADPSNKLKSEAQVKGILDVLLARGMIVWEFDIPFEFHPEDTLRLHLNNIEDEHLRKPALATLDEMERARDAIVQAAGDAQKLDEAINNLETVFTRLTGLSPTRESGKIYAGRTLVFEDCRRDIEAEIGTAFLDELAPPLSLLLTSGRWLTAEFAKLCRHTFKEIYDELVEKTGTKAVDGSLFWIYAQNIIFDGEGTHANKLLPGFQERWRKILPHAADARRVNYSSAELLPLVRAAFDAPAPGWKAALYNCPDVMVVAESVEAIRRGQYQLVMGELHIASNTIAGTPFVSQHPAPEELFEAVESDLPDTRAVPLTPKEWMTSRTNYVLVSPRDYRIEFDRSTSVAGQRSQALAVGDLVLEEIDGELVVHTRDGKLHFDIMEIFGFGLSGVIVNHLKIFAPEPRTPRVSIDRLVIAREAWRFPAAEIKFAYEKDEAERFLLARRWARALDIPRFVFIKVPVEPKPFYVDFDSPVLVNMLSKSVRRCAEQEKKDADTTVTLTEMLPSPDETWLPDAEGRRYTCELRMVAVDMYKKNGAAN